MARISPPKYLCTRAKQIFRTALPELGSSPTVIDLHLLGTYAQSLSEYEGYTAIITKDGASYKDKNKIVRKHPLLISQAKSFDMAKQAATTLGLDRKTRTKGIAGVTNDSSIRSLRKPPRKLSKAK